MALVMYAYQSEKHQIVVNALGRLRKGKNTWKIVQNLKVFYLFIYLFLQFSKQCSSDLNDKNYIFWNKTSILANKIISI